MNILIGPLLGVGVVVLIAVCCVVGVCWLCGKAFGGSSRNIGPDNEF